MPGNMFRYESINGIKMTVDKIPNDENDMVSVYDYMEYAERTMEENMRLSVNGGVTTELTYYDNPRAFTKYQLRPKLLEDVSKFTKDNTKVSLLGGRFEVSMPIGVAPFATHSWFHKSGEIGTANACDDTQTIFTASLYSSRSMEDISMIVPNAIKWQQLHLSKSKDFMLEIINRAECSGFGALVATIDRPTKRIRYNFLKGMCHKPLSLMFGNVPNFSSEFYHNCELNLSNSWEDLKWLKRHTKLPIIAKGILTAEAAVKAVQAGVDAVWVSNHGGRVLDSVPATIDVLSEVVEAVGHKVDVYMDGGIRSGLDVFKATAMGAKMVFVARPIVYGLYHSGQAGVRNVLEILHREFVNTAQMMGVIDMEALTQADVRKAHSRL